MEQSEQLEVSQEVPAAEAQQQESAAPSAAAAADTQQLPLPVEGERNYGYPDDFMIYSFKVEPCTRTDKHPRGSCPFAHAGDVARRRHPSRYQALLCPEVRAKKACPRLDDCQCSHSAFEFWLHPDRYRTSMCEKGQTCTRPVCFFAHSQEELRQLPQGLKPAEPDPGAASSSSSSKRRHTSHRPQQNPASLEATGMGGGLRYLQPQQQPQLVMQPGMQLMPLSPAAAAAASPGFAPMGYVPVVQPGAESGMAMPYGQLPSGLVMMPANQQQQYILQPALQHLTQQQGLEQQFQGLAVAQVAAGPVVDPPGPSSNPWQLQQQSLQPQRPLMMMQNVGALPAQAALQYPQQQLLYMPSPVEQGPWGAAAQQQQHPQGSGPYAPASSGFLQYAVPQQPYSSAGLPDILAGNPAGLQGGTVLAGNPGPSLMNPASGGFAGSIPQIVQGGMPGQQPQQEGPNW